MGAVQPGLLSGHYLLTERTHEEIEPHPLA
jgi:hypothetical protein